MTRRLYVVEDDLMFGQRARTAAARLGVVADVLSVEDAQRRPWQPDEVVLIQATLRPQRQQALIEEILRSKTPPTVVAVTGHLETELRKRLQGLGVRLAAHSSMDRALARALALSDGDDARGPETTRHDQSPASPSS